MSLLRKLEARIAAHGPISIADYIEAALTDPDHGYYMTRDPFGANGDFTTAPEVSQLFGELIGAWLADSWMQQGSPSPACLLELGPGRGTLMADILRATKRVPGFHHALHIYMCEASPVLSALQKRTLSGAHPRLHWISALSELSDLPLFFVANEFFDALPIRQFAGGEERMITLDNGALAFTHPAENITETCEAGEVIIAQLGAHMKRHGGAGIIIDYGYEGASNANTLQAVKQHAYADLLAQPGEADLTAHVSFHTLARAAHTAGITLHGPVSQGTFLRRLGIELRAAQLCAKAEPAQREALLQGMARLVSPAEMGELFKVLALCYPETPLSGFA